jgi:hypothetical protein
MAGPIPLSAVVEGEQAKERIITEEARATGNRLGGGAASERDGILSTPIALPNRASSLRPRALDESYDPRLLTSDEQDGEILLIREWLRFQRESSPEQQRLSGLLAQLERQRSGRRIAIERAEAELFALARTKPHKVDETIQRLALARGWATAEPPAYAEVAVVTANVLAYLRELTAPKNFDRHFRFKTFLAPAEVLTQQAVSHVSELARLVRLRLRSEKLGTRPMRPPLWDQALRALQAAREYFLILNDELRLEESSLVRSIDRAARISGTVMLVAVALPIAVATAVQAAPLVIGAARIATGVLFRGVLMRALTLYVSHPVRALFLSEFAVETTLDIIATGGVLEYLQSMRDPANLLPRLLNLFVIGVHLAPMSAKGRSPAQSSPRAARRTTLAVEVEVTEVTNEGARVRVRGRAHEVREGELDLPAVADDEAFTIERFDDVKESTRRVDSGRLRGLEESAKGPRQRAQSVSEETRLRNQRESLRRLAEADIETTATAPVHGNVGRSNRAVSDRLTRSKQLEGIGNEHFVRTPRGDDSERRLFAHEALEAIKTKEDHSLRFLIEDRVDPKTGKTVLDWRKTPTETSDGSLVYRRSEGNEKGVTIQVGHPVTRARGGADVFVIEDADLNQSTNRTIESRGGAAAKPFVYLDGLPVDLRSALQWERLGLLAPGSVARAPIVIPELPTP